MARSSQKAAREVLRVRRAVGRAEHALFELDRVLLDQQGICASDLGILERLSRKGHQTVNKLGERVGLTSGSITTAVQRLKSRGLLETLRAEKDRRVVLVSITPKGQAMTKLLTAERVTAMDAVLSNYSSRERDLLLGLLKRLRKAAGDRQTEPIA